MTMFTRNDKPADQPGTSAAAARETQPSRPQATAQTIPAPAPVRAASGVGVSVISKALKITGELESTEDIRIDGQVEGDVRGLSVTVGPDAKVKGTVFGDAVEVAGTIDGRIEAKTVVLNGTAHMSGDVVHQDIKIESGAFVDGHLKPGYTKSGANSAGSIASKSSASAAKTASAPAQADGAAKA